MAIVFFLKIAKSLKYIYLWIYFMDWWIHASICEPQFYVRIALTFSYMKKCFVRALKSSLSYTLH